MTTVARPASPKPIAAHGTLSRRKWHRCKCEPCRQKEREYENRRHRQIGYGTWGGLVDAEPVRAHIRTLQAAGGTIRVICQAANLPTSTLANIMYTRAGQPPCPTTRADNAAKILAVTPDDLTPFPATVVDSTGTRRRIQALVAIGWPLTRLGPEVGLHPRHMSEVLRRERVTADTAAAVRKNYRRLIGIDPLDQGIARHGITLAKNLAARRGWPPPTAWGSDIDNPAAVPDIEEAAEEVDRKRDKTRNDEIKHLAAYGIPHKEIALRVGLARANDVTTRLNEWAREDRDARKQVMA